MRLLIAHNDYGRRSGEEHAVSALAALAEKNGHRLGWFRRSSGEIADSVAGRGRAFLSGVHNPWMARKMASLLDTDKPDLVLVQNLYPFLSPSILAPCARRSVPVVMRCPNYRLFCPNGLHLSHGQVCERCLGGREYWCVLRNCEGSLFKSLGYAVRNAAARITRRILDNVTVFIVLSEFQKRRFIAQGIPEERLEILPNITPTVARDDVDDGGQKAEDRSQHSVLGPPSSGFVAFVGRASPEKGIEDFVAAARQLPHLPFAVAGDASRVSELVATSPQNVRWLGFLKGADLDNFYRQSRMLLVPCRWFEGFPNVVTHAMALRRPVIAARIGALPEIVDDNRTGLLYEPGNLAELTTNIRALYSHPERCRAMGEAGHAKATTQYSPDTVYHRLLQIFEKAIRIAGERQAVGAKR